MAYRTIQERGYCTRQGYARLDGVLRTLCSLGNAALQERRDAWRLCRRRIGYRNQTASLTFVRRDDPRGVGAINVAVARGALRRVDRAFAAFFRRCKAGEKPGYPRFRSASRYTTIETRDVTPSQVRHGVKHTWIRINGLPTIRIRRRRALPDYPPRAIRIVRRECGCGSTSSTRSTRSRCCPPAARWAWTWAFASA